MANQAPDRRQVLEMLAKAALASQFPGFSRWAYAYGKTAPTAAAYHPQCYTENEYQTIAMLAELIIPADEAPGAQAAGVSEFIDFLAFHGEDGLKPLRSGLAALDRAAEQAHSAPFRKLNEQQQTKLLESLAHTPFFKTIRQYTVMGYYTSRVGLEALDYPGLKMYTHSPECMHKDDPEHKHLSSAKA